MILILCLFIVFDVASKGRSHNLLKAGSKRKIGKYEKAEMIEEKRLKNEETNAKIA